MSKYVKNLMIKELATRWDGVEEVLLVDAVGLEVNDCVTLRRRLREKNIQMMVVKNSLARKATEGTALAPAFEGMNGSLSVVWGAEDVVSLAKEVVALSEGKEYEKFQAIGGVLEGAKLSREEVKQVSKWPNRAEMLSILVGQVLSPAMTLSGQLLGPGKLLASQVKQKSEEEGSDEG